MCQAYRLQHGLDATSAMPTNLYGPRDNFHPENSHVLPAFIRRFHEAKVNDGKEVVVWGTGSPLREFLHVDDLADAVVFLMDRVQFLKNGTFFNSEPDLRAMREHDSFHYGSEISFTDVAKFTISILCFDCGKCFKTPRSKQAHVAGRHPAGIKKQYQMCNTCGYKHKNLKQHLIAVNAPLQVPPNYGIQEHEDEPAHEKA